MFRLVVNGVHADAVAEQRRRCAGATGRWNDGDLQACHPGRGGSGGSVRRSGDLPAPPVPVMPMTGLAGRRWLQLLDLLGQGSVPSSSALMQRASARIAARHGRQIRRGRRRKARADCTNMSSIIPAKPRALAVLDRVRCATPWACSSSISLRHDDAAAAAETPGCRRRRARADRSCAKNSTWPPW